MSLYTLGPAVAFTTTRRDPPSFDSLDPARWLLSKASLKADFARLDQVHGTEIYFTSRATDTPYPKADAIVTNRRSLAVVVLTADCVPILLADEKSRVVAAVHAGWRGVYNNIVRATLSHLYNRFGIHPKELHVALGPSIGPCCYEVSEELAADFSERWGREYLSGEDGTPHLDLPSLVMDQLLRYGVEFHRIQKRGQCTLCHQKRYYSFRGGDERGRLVSGVMLPEAQL